jgi:hypothetical protein
MRVLLHTQACQLLNMIEIEFSALARLPTYAKNYTLNLTMEYLAIDP